MRKLLLLAGAAVALASCATDDEYYYGYAQAYRQLPDGFERVEVGGTPYWHHGGRFYRYDEKRGYLLVRPPHGAEQVVAAAGAPPAPSGEAMTPDAESESGGFFDPGVLKERGRPRSVGRSPLRRRMFSAD